MKEIIEPTTWEFEWDRQGEMVVMEYVDYMQVIKQLKYEWEDNLKELERIHRDSQFYNAIRELHKEVVCLETVTSKCQECKTEYPCTTIQIFRNYKGTAL